MLRAGTFALLFGFACATAMASQASPSVSPREKYDALAKSTRLDAEGQAPFHIRIEAQLFNLDGKPSEKATIEEWWTPSKQYRIEIKSPSLQETTSSLDHTDPSMIHRNGYLLRELLDQAIHPLPKLGSEENTTITESDRTLGGVSMHCLALQNPKAPRSGVPQSYCVDANGALRILANASEVITRNRTGHFRDSSVALQTSIVFLSREAVPGEVKALQSFDPAQSSLAEFAPNAAPSSDPATDAVPQPSGVVAGRKVSGDPPHYPVIAREQHRTGSVVLCGLINTAGKLSAVDVLTGSDPLLTQAAVEAVRTWTYKPYLLNGKATSVQTTITVNFAMSS